jgi:hypothetical protein
MSKVQFDAYWLLYWSNASDDQLRHYINLLLSEGSEQFWLNGGSAKEKYALKEIRQRGLWSDKDELQSRLEGVVKRN